MLGGGGGGGRGVVFIPQPVSMNKVIFVSYRDFQLWNFFMFSDVFF